MPFSSSLLLHLATTAATPVARGRLAILIYHRVLSQPDPLQPGTVDADAFRWQMALLAKYFTPLALGEAVDRLDTDSLPPRAVAVTFDDGYRDNLVNAAPILHELQVPATVFIATDYLGTSGMWVDEVREAIRALPAGAHDLSTMGLGQWTLSSQEDRVRALDSVLGRLRTMETSRRSELSALLGERAGRPALDVEPLMLKAEELGQLRGEHITIGAHTASHPRLARLDKRAAAEDIERGRSRLMDILGEPVDLFAFPFGRAGQDQCQVHADLVRELGFRAAVTTDWGVADRNTPRWGLPRFTPWDKTTLRFGLRLAYGYRNLMSEHRLASLYQACD